MSINITGCNIEEWKIKTTNYMGGVEGGFLLIISVLNFQGMFLF